MKIKIPRTRLTFPADETIHSWLGLLLDAYAVTDREISKAIAGYEKKTGLKLACRLGCSACCRTHTDIPIYPLEITGIYWYVIEKMTEPARSVIMRQLAVFLPGAPCPFLMNDICGIHSLRPIACRMFNVFSNPCAEKEDPFFTRRHDVLDQVTEAVNQAFFIMLPFYGVSGVRERESAVKQGVLHRQATNIMTSSWKNLYIRMKRYDTLKAGISP